MGITFGHIEAGLGGCVRFDIHCKAAYPMNADEFVLGGAVFESAG